MAFPSSFIPSATVRDALNNVIALAAGPASSADSLKLALFNNSAVMTINDDPSTYGAGNYASNEVTGTNWSSGGVALSSNSLALTSNVGVTFSAGNVSVATTTVSNAYGCAIYDTTLSPKCVLVTISFGGGYSTTAGTFGITWSGSGIFYITL